MEFWNKFIQDFNSTFIVDDRWKFFVSGLEATLLMSFFGLILGFIIGLVMAFMKLSKYRLPRWIANIYIDIIRGTPTMVQLFIIYFLVFATVNIDRRVVGIIAFGINSGAYVAEIIRGGILSIDKGQVEAGRSLGMSNFQTMRRIVFPQAIKNVFPALGNEFIVLVKETAIIGYIAKLDFMAAALKVQSLTYSYFVPLLSVAVGYYVIVKILTFILNRIEKRLRRADMR